MRGALLCGWGHRALQMVLSNGEPGYAGDAPLEAARPFQRSDVGAHSVGQALSAHGALLPHGRATHNAPGRSSP